MALTRQAKEAIVAEVSDVATKAVSVVIALNHGLSAEDMTDLRKIARKMQVYLKIVPNTLLVRAFKDTSFSCLEDQLVGPTIIAFSLGEPGASGKLIKEFAKTHEKLGVKALAIGGKAFDAKQIDMLANLPSYEQALGLLVGVMQAPITKFARTTSEIYAKLVRVTAEVSKQKQAV